ncbi:hypothetical protein WA026_022245 [Henosepilachna vigintioctopunctata]|uniref:Uncharacterized protein n=1 Tax=Henosepilachna vigintioctopunctata TaxID=420089 RepID=A0AAW1UNF1_9CUCU
MTIGLHVKVIRNNILKNCKKLRDTKIVITPDLTKAQLERHKIFKYLLKISRSTTIDRYYIRGEKIHPNKQIICGIITVDNILETDNLNKFRQSIGSSGWRNERKEEEIVGRQVHFETGIDIELNPTRNKKSGKQVIKPEDTILRAEGKEEKETENRSKKFTTHAIQNENIYRKNPVTTRGRRHTSN